MFEADGEWIDTVYITASCPEELTPGLLCRQMLSELGVPQLRFVLITTHSISVHLLTELYPHPPLYRKIPGSAVLAHASQFSLRCQPVHTAAWAATSVAAIAASGTIERAYQQALAVASKGDRKDVVHPLRYASALVWADGTIKTALQDRLVEYGACVDACCKFILAIEGLSSTTAPAVLLQVDQYGVLHAPHAQARSYFHEFGLDDVVVPVHTPQGSVELMRVSQLAPCKAWSSY